MALYPVDVSRYIHRKVRSCIYIYIHTAPNNNSITLIHNTVIKYYTYT